MQGKTDGELLSWLAGFVDGEGSLVIIRMSGTDKRKNPRLQPRIQIANTHWPTLDQLTEMLTRLGLPHYIGEKRVADQKDGFRRKPQWVLMAVGLKRTMRWCQALLPYLVTKRDQAELMIEFCHSRLSSSSNGKGPKAVLPREMFIMNELVRLHH